MDEPALPVDLHHAALEGLRRINAASGAAARLAEPLLKFAREHEAEHGSHRPVTLLDVAAGGGDVPVAIVAAARAAGSTIRLTLFDRSEAALARAKETADRAGIDATLACGDVVNSDLPVSADIVSCSLFLHHLTQDQTVAVLKRLRSATNGLLLVSDLRRCVSGVAAAHLACRLLTRSSVVHFDGPVSARAAWTISEMQAMANAAGMADATIRAVWPFRLLLTWKKPKAEKRSVEKSSV